MMTAPTGLDPQLRAELRTAFVPYDAVVAEHMINTALGAAADRRPTRWMAPAATAAAVAAIATAGAFVYTSSSHPERTDPAGASASSGARLSTAPSPRPGDGGLRAAIEHCINTDGSVNWGIEHDNCGDVLSECQIKDALHTTPCSLIPPAVVSNAPRYQPATGPRPTSASTN
jgi:hypothetical protein